jgi:hypothetical protein
MTQLLYLEERFMKKPLAVFAVLLVVLPLAFAQGVGLTIRAFLPMDFSGTYAMYGYIDDENKVAFSDTKSGNGIGAEVLYNVVRDLDIGIGFQYGSLRSLNDSDTDAKFNEIPIYGIIVYNFDIGLGWITPYGISRFGYALQSGNSAMTEYVSLGGGYHFTIGCGVDFKIPRTPLAAFAEADYAYDEGTMTYDELDITLNTYYSRVQACLGLALSF